MPAPLIALREAEGCPTTSHTLLGESVVQERAWPKNSEEDDALEPEIEELTALVNWKAGLSV